MSEIIETTPSSDSKTHNVFGAIPLSVANIYDVVLLEINQLVHFAHLFDRAALLAADSGLLGKPQEVSIVSFHGAGDPSFTAYLKEYLHIDLTTIDLSSVLISPAQLYRTISDACQQLNEQGISELHLSHYTQDLSPQSARYLRCIKHICKKYEIELITPDISIEEIIESGARSAVDLANDKWFLQQEVSNPDNNYPCGVIEGRIGIELSYDQYGIVTEESLIQISDHIVQIFDEGKDMAWCQTVVGAGGGIGTCKIKQLNRDGVKKSDQEIQSEIRTKVLDVTNHRQDGKLQPTHLLVAPHLEITSSPSTSFMVGENGLEDLKYALQVLNGENACEGVMMSPDLDCQIQEAMLKASRIWAQKLSNMGYRGPSNLDFVITTKDGQQKLMIAESNTRYTASKNPSKIEDHLHSIQELPQVAVHGNDEFLVPADWTIDDLIRACEDHEIPLLRFDQSGNTDGNGFLFTTRVHTTVDDRGYKKAVVGYVCAHTTHAEVDALKKRLADAMCAYF